MECNAAIAQKYNPVRLWMYCGDCHHLYAEEFPVFQSIDAASGSQHDLVAMPTNPGLFAYYSNVFSKLSISQGKRLLEIGIGGAELSLVADEMGYDTLGLDISAGNVNQARKYGLNAELHDFMEFDTNAKWDIVAMGDVIEHVPDPVAALKKTRELLNDGGVLWLSTPNFDGAFARNAGHNDPMRKEPSHKNYFSRNSLFKLLEMFHFKPVNYQISGAYNGSFEVIAIKE